MLPFGRSFVDFASCYTFSRDHQGKQYLNRILPVSQLQEQFKQVADATGLLLMKSGNQVQSLSSAVFIKRLKNFPLYYNQPIKYFGLTSAHSFYYPFKGVSPVSKTYYFTIKNGIPPSMKIEQFEEKWQNACYQCIPFKQFQKIYPGSPNQIDPITQFRAIVPNDICLLLIIENCNANDLDDLPQIQMMDDDECGLKQNQDLRLIGYPSEYKEASLKVTEVYDILPGLATIKEEQRRKQLFGEFKKHMHQQWRKSFSKGILLKKGDFIAHTCSGWRGMSGGPIVSMINGTCKVVGIYTGSGTYPLAFQISQLLDSVFTKQIDQFYDMMSFKIDFNPVKSVLEKIYAVKTTQQQDPEQYIPSGSFNVENEFVKMIIQIKDMLNESGNRQLLTWFNQKCSQLEMRTRREFPSRFPFITMNHCLAYSKFNELKQVMRQIQLKSQTKLKSQVNTKCFEVALRLRILMRRKLPFILDTIERCNKLVDRLKKAKAKFYEEIKIIGEIKNTKEIKNAKEIKEDEDKKENDETVSQIINLNSISNETALKLQEIYFPLTSMFGGQFEVSTAVKMNKILNDYQNFII